MEHSWNMAFLSESNLAWLCGTVIKISVKRLLSIYSRLYPESGSAGHISLAVVQTHAFTSTPVSAEYIRTHLLYERNEVKITAGAPDSGCGLQSDEIQKPTAPSPLVCGCRDMGRWGGETERTGGHWKLRATRQPAPRDPWQVAVAAQPAAPTLLPLSLEPQPDPAAVCFTTLNHC